MLENLYIKNIALISERTVELESGLTVFSGETGSGKSIVIDAINFMLGAKADKTLIRHGEEEARVDGVFDVTERNDVAAQLAEFGVEADDKLLISRSMVASGRSEIRVNGKLLTLSMLRQITHKLVDVHGQSDHFLLSDEKMHVAILDAFGGSELERIIDAFSGEYDKYMAYKRELGAFGGSDAERARLIDLYTYQVGEIDGAALQIGEEDELEAKFSMLANAEKIAEALKIASEALGGEGRASEALSESASAVYSVARYNEKFNELSERLKSAKIEIDDVNDAIDDFLQNINYDEFEADKVGNRIELIKNLKRKYGSSIEEILRYRDKAERELQKLQSSEEEISRLNAEIERAHEVLLKKGAELTEKRKSVAKRFEQAVIGELNTLAMENCCFAVAFTEGDFDKLLSRRGADSVSFMLSANRGEPLMPLTKIISGGEMSRLMLAIKSITGNLGGVSTMIFDEVDTGISGKVAHTVAEKFLALAKTYQVIVITHLPQIAAAAQHNMLISKSAVGDKTETYMKRLSGAEKIDEIIRLSGAKGRSEAAVTNAVELIRAYEQLGK